MNKTVKEFYAAKTEDTQIISVVMLIDNNEEIRVKLPRDIAIGMIEQLYIALQNGSMNNIVDFQ